MRNLLEHTRRPDITFSRDGRIRISARLARALSLAPGDAVNIAFSDGEFPCQRASRGTCSCSDECRRNCNHVEYLLYAIPSGELRGRHQACCYVSKRGGGHHFLANSVQLSRAMLDLVGPDVDKAAFLVGDPRHIQDQIYIPIITRHALL